MEENEFRTVEMIMFVLGCLLVASFMVAVMAGCADKGLIDIFYE